MGGRPVTLSLALCLAAPALAGACSPAPPLETPRPAAPRATATAAAPPAPRKLTGTPVALTLRRPAAASGAEWAWIMPEGKLATLTSPGKEGQRGILGPNFYSGPGGSLVGIASGGELDLAVDSKVYRLGRFDNVSFGPEARHVMVWDSIQWTLLSRTGDRIAGAPIADTRPLLLPSGALLLDLAGARTRLLDLPGKVHFEAPYPCPDVFPVAGMLACVDNSSPRAPVKRILSLATGEEIARVTSGSITVSASGKTAAVAREAIEVFQLDGKKKEPRSRVLFRKPDYLRSYLAGRMALTADGRHLCLEEYQGTRVLETASDEWRNSASSSGQAGPRGTRPTCLFAPRGPASDGPDAGKFHHEWDAVLVNVPVREGYGTPAWRVTERQRFETEAISYDRKIGALIEQRRAPQDGQLRYSDQIVIVDLMNVAVKTVIPLGDYTVGGYSTPDVPRVELSDNGALARVCASRLIPEGCRTFDTATGAALKGGSFPRPIERRTELVIWSGEWPDSKVAETLASIKVPVDGRARVISWKDEGAYLSIELDLPGGKTVHLNVPDNLQRVASDVVALAGGGMLAIGMQGVVELWTTESPAIRAVLVATEGGGAAFFNDGSVEIIGGAESALGCQQDNIVLPLDACGDARAASGSLAALLKSAEGRTP